VATLGIKGKYRVSGRRERRSACLQRLLTHEGADMTEKRAADHAGAIAFAANPRFFSNRPHPVSPARICRCRSSVSFFKSIENTEQHS